MHLQIRTPSPTTVEFTVSTSPLASKQRFTCLLISACTRTALILVSAALALRRMFPEFLRWRWLLRLEKDFSYRWANGLGTPMTVFLGVLVLIALAGIGGCGKEESLLLIRHMGIQTSSSTISPLPLSFWPPSLSFRTAMPAPADHSKRNLTISRFTSYKPDLDTSYKHKIKSFFAQAMRGFAYTRKTRFIPTSMVQDIFIHEGFRGFEVRFYLVVVVKGEEDMVVVFPETLPKRKVLETVWRGARRCLFGSEIMESDNGINGKDASATQGNPS